MEGSKDLGCEEDSEKPRKTPRRVKLNDRLGCHERPKWGRAVKFQEIHCPVNLQGLVREAVGSSKAGPAAMALLTRTAQRPHVR